VSEWVSEWMSEWVNEWMNKWITDWLNEWMMHAWLNEWMNKWMNEWKEKKAHVINAENFHILDSSDKSFHGISYSFSRLLHLIHSILVFRIHYTNLGRIEVIGSCCCYWFASHNDGYLSWTSLWRKIRLKFTMANQNVCLCIC